ncbi:MAG: GTP-binding protein [Chthoniobacterales bacterium]|nr:GTP-binding protein [Chthoniobacterales bacterium]
MESLLGRIHTSNPTAPSIPNQHQIRIAIVGRPNTGKSSLLNALVGEERAIVSEIPGTTRNLVETPFTFNNKHYLLCDTAGLRHRSRHKTSVEVFSAIRTEKAIEIADLCILLLDASRSVSSQDKKIAQIILKKEKATVVAINKWDLIQNHKNSLIEKFRRDLFFLYWAPFIPISAQKKTGLKNLFTHISKVEKQAKQRIGTGELNRLLQDSLQSYPPPIRSGKRFKIYYSAQVLPKQNTPFSPPEIVFFVNNPHLLLNSYREFLLRQIRSKWPFCGLPILLHLRGKLSQKNLNQ